MVWILLNLMILFALLSLSNTAEVIYLKKNQKHTSQNQNFEGK